MSVWAYYKPSPRDEERYARAWKYSRRHGDSWNMTGRSPECPEGVDKDEWRETVFAAYAKCRRLQMQGIMQQKVVLWTWAVLR